MTAAAFVETVADATEMLGYHERTEVGDFRAFAALARSIRQDYLDAAAKARAKTADR